MLIAILVTTAVGLLGLLLAVWLRSTTICPVAIKSAMFRMWDRHPWSYDASAVAAGWVTSLVAVGLLAAGYVGAVKLFG